MPKLNTTNAPLRLEFIRDGVDLKFSHTKIDNELKDLSFVDQCRTKIYQLWNRIFPSKPESVREEDFICPSTIKVRVRKNLADASYINFTEEIEVTALPFTKSCEKEDLTDPFVPAFIVKISQFLHNLFHKQQQHNPTNLSRQSIYIF